ncbi:MAG TPA: UDP-N-acetylmuramate dehydrogenase [Candidatus Dormibacteraeota bacterium]|nr:UDP-N-acetylmuramate dehydrogenase [Candidatus Dormibacteraeota bacterium]
MPDSWLADFPGVREHEPLEAHSWYRIGGLARYFLEVSDDSVLPELLEHLRRDGIGLLVIGAGSNTLFAAREQPGLTLKLATERQHRQDDLVTVSAGVLMPRLAADTAREGRSGLEFGAGVPGTVGGSIYGNAGAFGREIKDCLATVAILTAHGERQVLSGTDCRFGYRDSVFKSELAGSVILEASFRTSEDSPERIRERIKQVQKHRRDTQPIEKRSLGSTFKNPAGDSAGRLIEAAGLKGRRLGAAEVSRKHANFIVNLGGATADDVLALMAEMRERVREQFGVELEPEIRIVGAV